MVTEEHRIVDRRLLPFQPSWQSCEAFGFDYSTPHHQLDQFLLFIFVTTARLFSPHGDYPIKLIQPAVHH
jgi:hypothetical protein